MDLTADGRSETLKPLTQTEICDRVLKLPLLFLHVYYTCFPPRRTGPYMFECFRLLAFVVGQPRPAIMPSNMLSQIGEPAKELLLPYSRQVGAKILLLSSLNLGALSSVAESRCNFRILTGRVQDYETQSCLCSRRAVLWRPTKGFTWRQIAVCCLLVLHMRIVQEAVQLEILPVL